MSCSTSAPIEPDCEKFAWAFLDAEKVARHAGLELRRRGRRPYPHQPLPAGRRAEGSRRPPRAASLAAYAAARRREHGQLPSKARAVIIGGGVSGCSVAYHLAKLGWTDIVLLERKQLTSGTTWHAAGLIGQLRGSQNMTRLAKYSADLYVKLEAETGVATGMRQVGSITVALTEERKHEIYRQATVARAFDVDVREISPSRSQGDVPASQHGRRGRRGAPAARRPVRPGQHRHGAGQGRAPARREDRRERQGHERSHQGRPRHRRLLGTRRRARHHRSRHRRQLRRHVGARTRRQTGVTIPLHACEHFYLVTEADPGPRPPAGAARARTNAPTTRRTPAR